MKKDTAKSLANYVEILHIAIFFITITFMVTIFAYKPLELISALWLIGLWTIERIYGVCPLTIKEYNLRKQAGQKIKKTKFIPRFLKKYFHLNFPDWLADLWLTLYFLISLIILLSYFY